MNPNDSPEILIDKHAVRASFNRAVNSYEQHAILQNEVLSRLFDRLEWIKLQPRTILDLGSGIGTGSTQLLQRYPKSHVISLDFAENMLTYAKKQRSLLQKWRYQQSFLCADAEHLPLADHSVDMVFSNLTLQWCQNLPRLFAEFARVLKPEGLLMFTTLGPDTLKELRHAWLQENRRAHVNAFFDMHDIGDQVLRAKLSDPVLDVEYIKLHYQNTTDVMKDLKGIGARNMLAQRHRGLTGKNTLKAVTARYEQLREEGGLPCTYEVIFGQAWATIDHAQNAHEKGQPAFSIEQLKAQLPSQRSKN